MDQLEKPREAKGKLTRQERQRARDIQSQGTTAGLTHPKGVQATTEEEGRPCCEDCQTRAVADGKSFKKGAGKQFLQEF